MSIWLDTLCHEIAEAVVQGVQANTSGERQSAQDRYQQALLAAHFELDRRGYLSEPHWRVTNDGFSVIFRRKRNGPDFVYHHAVKLVVRQAVSLGRAPLALCPAPQGEESAE